jgi:hypothetical protein
MVQKVIFRFIYGEADAYELRKVKEHLDVCQRCRRESEIIADILDQIRLGLPEEPVPEGFRTRVLERVHALADAEGYP